MSIVFSSDERQEFRPGKLEAFEAIMALAIGHAFGCYNPKQWADYLGLSPQKIYAQMQTWSLYRLQEVLLKMMVFQASEQIKAVKKKVQLPNQELKLLCP
ncbi:MAG: hypothetical protein QNJ41_18020 [Xenococcaceae cyanobacterium MO_188.B32]|nr:hypothetical protein [Xenococcaceae cyanobacterium MO_188.B32]